MKSLLLLGYSDVFDEPLPSLNELLHNVPVDAILVVSSLLNSALYAENRKINQLSAFSRLLQSNHAWLVDHIWRIALKRSNGKGDSVFLFCRESLTELLSLSLKLSTRNKKDEFLTPEQGLSIAKAILICNNRVIRNQTFDFKEKGKSIHKPSVYRELMWSTSIEQIPRMMKGNPRIALSKSILFFEFLAHQRSFKKVVDSYFFNTFKLTPIQLSAEIAYWFSNLYESKEVKFYLEIDDSFTHKLGDFCLDADDLNACCAIESATKTFLKKPLVVSKNRAYIVDWEFIVAKIERGLIIDFFVKNRYELGFNNLKDFKSYVATKFSEKFYFTAITRRIFQIRNAILNFGQETQFPDAVVHSNKVLYLLELKDTWLSENALQYGNIEMFKNELKTKFEGDKGIGQLIRAIKSEFEESLLSKFIGYPLDEVRAIQPILVYTDKNFEIPGVAAHLNEEFNNLSPPIPSTILLEELCFVSLDYLAENLDSINKLGFKVLFKEFSRDIRNKKKTFKKASSLRMLTALEDLNQSHESVLSKVVRKSKVYKHKPFDILDLLQEIDQS